jgi:phosphoribosylpyrophosphate synthetase
MASSIPKLLLVPCSGDETLTLAERIFQILREDYGLQQGVEILKSSRRSEVNRDTIKDNRHPLVSDLFGDQEVQVDIGRNELKDVIRGKHIALVEHLLTPNRRVSENDTQLVSVNDHIMAVRGFLDLVGKVDTLQRTLVAPYLTYVRSHSIEKYEDRGFFQFDSLRKTLADYRGDGLKGLITIDPHSMKSAQIAEELGIDFHAINPFQSARAINPYKLGLTGERAKTVMQGLRPFQERFKTIKEQNPDHLYVVSVDDGTEKRTENFTERAFAELSPEELYARLAYLDKDRISYENSIARFKHFSQINENNIDREGTYVIIDDMFASASTANKVATILKRLGAEKVEVWTSHAITMYNQHEKANDRTHIDSVVCLDTVPQHQGLNIEYLTATAGLMAAELYKAHQKLVSTR